eukprot:Skav215053  [mRNA]  locus=scaffold1021:239020:246877:- [translate_table: standard]
MAPGPWPGAVLGVSVSRGFLMNSVTVPRLPGEADSNGQGMTVNVEYNQLDPLLKNTPAGGDVADSSGFSPYPGNINVLVFRVPQMAERLAATGGIVPEFVNPKWADAEKSKFKSPTRLESLMQDFPMLCRKDDPVGFTQMDRLMSFTAVKNNLADAAKKNPPDCALSAEAMIYACLRRRETRNGEGKVHGGPLLGGQDAPVPDCGPSCANQQEPHPEDLSHEDLCSQRGPGEEPLLVLHEEAAGLQLNKAKKSGGELLSVNELFDTSPTKVKNYGIWLRYDSRTNTHNMYKEFRNVNINGAVGQLYQEMAGRHRADPGSIQIIHAATVPDEQCRREHVLEMHPKGLKFPVIRKIPNTIKKLRTTFKAKRANTFVR